MTNDMFSGDAGDVTHPWRRAMRTLGERAFSAIHAALLTGSRVDRLARTFALTAVVVPAMVFVVMPAHQSVPILAATRSDNKRAGAGGSTSTPSPEHGPSGVTTLQQKAAPAREPSRYSARP